MTDNIDIDQPGKKEKMKKKFLDFLGSEGGGNALFTCKNLGFARSTMYKWRDEDKKFMEEWDDAMIEGKETLADEAEAYLRKIVRDGKLGAITFTLKNLRPDKWKDRQTIEHEFDLQEETRKIDERIERRWQNQEDSTKT